MNPIDSHQSAGGPSTSCSLREVFSLMGTSLPDTSPPDPVAVATLKIAAGHALFEPGMEAHAIHVVRTGAFKTLRTDEDGHEQVLGFTYRGELLGHDALWDNTRRSAVVALEDATVIVLPVRDFFALARISPAFEHGVLCAIGRSLRGCSELADMMAAVAAEVRLGRFLLQLSRQMAAAGQSPSSLCLRMPRRDIASYLGVAHETVSRSFAALTEREFITVHQRHVEIIDLGALQRFAQGTRTPVRSGRPRKIAAPRPDRQLAQVVPGTCPTWPA